MSGPVDVLSVMDEAAEQLNSVYSADDLRKSLVEARAAVAELIEAADSYAEAEEALANRELSGVNAESHDKLQRRLHAARRDMEYALASVRGDQNG